MSDKPKWGWVQANGADMVVTYRTDIPSPEEFAEKMRKAMDDDPEASHIEGDALMCELLQSFGYSDAVKIFEQARKWYA